MNVRRALRCIISVILSMMLCCPCFAQDDERDAQRELRPEVLVALMELNVLGRTSPRRPLKERLAECERVSGLVTEITPSLPVQERLAALMQEAPFSESLMALVDEVESAEKDGKSRIIDEWRHTCYQSVGALEIPTFGSVELGKSLLHRVERLEQYILKRVEPDRTKGLHDRILNLIGIVRPSEKDATEATWMSMGLKERLRRAVPDQPARVPGWSAAERTAKRGAEGTKSILTSPTFWKVVGVTAVLGAAAVGTVFLLKKISAGSGYINSEGYCTGLSNCAVCTSCNYCMHCRNPSFVLPCGVYFRVRMLPYY